MRSSYFAVPAALSRLARISVPFVMMISCLWLLQTRVDLPSMQALSRMMTQVTPLHWAGAVLATGISFWALGRYDLVAHRHFGTGLSDQSARKAGMAAIALSQTVGFGLFTGSFARWRLLPGLRPIQAAQLTGFVAVTFLAALTFVCATLCLFLPLSEPLKWVAALTLACLFFLIGLCIYVPEIHFGNRKFRLPSLTAMLALIVWAFFDVTAAGTALWLLLPEGADISWSLLMQVYFLALGAAVISSAPGGFGPFELTLFALLPSQNSTELMAAVIAFRLVYFALPALVSALVLTFPALVRRGSAASTIFQRQPSEMLPETCLRSETGIIHQNGGQLLSSGFEQVAVLDSPQCSIGLFDPLAAPSTTGLAWLKNYARSRNATACVYKCSAPTAQGLRRAGWKVLRIAEEAILNPTIFSEDGASRRQLRRKLRQATKAGVEVRAAASHLPLAQMARVDQAWQHSHGRALGTTMGRFELNYLSHQRVFLAWRAQEIIGFVSFHVSTQEWCLDLVRILPGAPDGTGHALIREAIAVAAGQNLSRLSLAAVPDHRLAHHVDKGLRRFKTCFCPNWQPLYMAAPSWWHMTLCIGELLRLIHRPPALPPTATDNSHRPTPTTAFPPPHNEDEQNGIALSRSA